MNRPFRRPAARGALLIALAACHAAPAPQPPAPASAPSRATPPAPPSPDQPTADSVAAASAVAVAAEAGQLFGDSSGGAAIAPAEMSSADSQPTWDIDVHGFEARERVAFYIDRFQGEARPRMTIWLQRGGRYETMIRAKLRAAALPEDLVYLALIESGYDPNAYSSAAAVGMWQMMTGTARGTGLRVDWWVDERRDPVRSTDGAIRFLGWLHRQFGSLYLAAAAYNGGPGRVARGLVRYADELEGQSGDSAYFTLAESDYLRAETRDYVPKLIAAAMIAKAPRRYGFDVTLDAPLSYDSVLAPPALPLAAVATAAGVSLASVLDLNYHILRGMTPPKVKWWVRVPAGSAPRADSGIVALSKLQRQAGKRIELSSTATMATISHKYGISSRQLTWYNPALKKAKPGTKVYAGTVLYIPSAATLAGARDVPDPSIERYGHSRKRTVTHVVRQGETLASIAARYDTSVASLKKLNGLKQTVIYPGQVIVVRRAPGGGKKKQAR